MSILEGRVGRMVSFPADLFPECTGQHSICRLLSHILFSLRSPYAGSARKGTLMKNSNCCSEQPKRRTTCGGELNVGTTVTILLPKA